MTIIEDINIICKQTNLKYDEALDIYKKNNNNIIDTICFIENIDPIEEKKETLTEVQLKIKELREIVDKKDELMETIINKSRN